jgi:hypothetical protein
MVAPLVKIVTVVIIVVFVVTLIPAVAPFVTERLPHFGNTVGNLLEATWDAFRNMVNKLGFSL